MKPIKFSLTISGEVLPDGGDLAAQGIAMTEKDLQRNLEYPVQHAMSNGMVTGDTPATLDSYESNITIN